MTDGLNESNKPIEVTSIKSQFDLSKGGTEVTVNLPSAYFGQKTVKEAKYIAIAALSLTLVNFFGLVMLVDQYNQDKSYVFRQLDLVTQSTDDNTKELNCMRHQYDDPEDVQDAKKNGKL